VRCHGGAINGVAGAQTSFPVFPVVIECPLHGWLPTAHRLPGSLLSFRLFVSPSTDLSGSDRAWSFPSGYQAKVLSLVLSVLRLWRP
jgi:hypothetical protein